MQPLWKKCDVVTVIFRVSLALPLMLLCLPSSPFRQTASQLQLRCNQPQVLASTCTNLHLFAPTCATCTKKYFVRKIKVAEASGLCRPLNLNASSLDHIGGPASAGSLNLNAAFEILFFQGRATPPGSPLPSSLRLSRRFASERPAHSTNERRFQT